MNIAAASSSPSSAVPTGSWPGSPSCSATAEAAERHFESALAMDQRMGSVVHIAETLARHAVAVHHRGTDPRRARDARSAGPAVAEPIGQLRALRSVGTGAGSAATDGSPSERSRSCASWLRA